ncbi:MAG: toll/interleukin-1 receptor domain-containing protein [Pseudomonadota bacterium]
MAYDIFISYRRTDQSLARALVFSLEARGIAVWWDQKIEGGEDWRDTIVEGLTNSKALVILFSESCNQSKQLKKELAVADTLDKVVVPVLIEDTKPKGHYLYELAALNWLQTFPDAERKMDGLADRLIDELELDATPVAPVFSAEPVGEPGSAAPSEPTPSRRPAPKAPPPPPPSRYSYDEDEMPLEADTVRKIVQQGKTAKIAELWYKDFLPFKWYEGLIAAAFSALAVWGTTMPVEGAPPPDPGMEVTPFTLTLDGIGMFFLLLLVIAMVVFPVRYYFRRRRVGRAARYYAYSVGTLAVILGVVFGVHPHVADQELGLGENLFYALLGSIFVFGFISLVTFGIYGLLHFNRTMRSFDRNLEAI